MANLYFLKDPNVIAALQLITELAGPNFAAPYDALSQPTDGMAMNQDDLLQYQLPGGSTLQGYSAPGETSNMGKVISVLMGSIAPIISSYMMLLPIIGVIRGILEVICAMMNPWAVIKAVKRLFKKWIPRFVAMFPPFAGIILVLNIIKVLLAVTYFILTVLLPIIELIKVNIKVLADAFGADGNEQKQQAGKRKIESLLMELLNQMGLISLLRPVLDLIFLILKMKTKLPCKKKKKKKGQTTDNECGTDAYDPVEDDSSCCSEDACPCFLKYPPKGKALVAPSLYSDAPQLWAWKIIPLSGQDKIKELVPYMQSFKAQLDSQLDEPVDESKTAGQSGDSAHFSIKITGKRSNSVTSLIGITSSKQLKNSSATGGVTKTIPITKIKGYNMWVIDPSLIEWMGVVEYEIVPNWDALVARGIVGLACHPDIDDAKDVFSSGYAEADYSGEENHPDVSGLEIKHGEVETDLNNFMDKLSTTIGSVNSPPFDSQLAEIDNIRDDMTNLLLGYKDYLIGLMNGLLSGIINPNLSNLDVDKNLVRSGLDDKAIISVIPRDTSGSLLAKALPQGVSVNVDLFTDFGTISNQVLNSSTGVITADLTSQFPGDANVTAKVNTQYIMEEIDTGYIVKEITVKFVSDAVLPKRRLVSKQRTDVEPHSTIDS